MLKKWKRNDVSMKKMCFAAKAVINRKEIEIYDKRYK